MQAKEWNIFIPYFWLPLWISQKWSDVLDGDFFTSFDIRLCHELKSSVSQNIKSNQIIINQIYIYVLYNP